MRSIEQESLVGWCRSRSHPGDPTSLDGDWHSDQSCCPWRSPPGPLRERQDRRQPRKRQTGASWIHSVEVTTTESADEFELSLGRRLLVAEGNARHPQAAPAPTEPQAAAAAQRPKSVAGATVAKTVQKPSKSAKTTPQYGLVG